MRPFLLFSLVFIYSLSCCAQYDSAVHFRMPTLSFRTAADTLIQRAAADPTDTGEGSTANVLLRWEKFMGSRISNDVGQGSDMTAPLAKATSYYISHISNYCNSGSSFNGNWKCLGPFNGYYDSAFERQGRVDAIWVNPKDTNTILVGSDAGGLWKSSNHMA